MVSKNQKFIKTKGIIAMKQKYLVINDKENKQIKILEYAELNKEMLSLLCEESYDYKTLKSAITAGSDTLIATLRTNNLYPPGIYAKQIASAVTDLYKSKDRDSLELFFDDINLLAQNRKSVEIAEQIEDDPADLDEMLEDGFEDTIDDKNDLKKIDSSIKVAGDDFGDAEDSK